MQIFEQTAGEGEVPMGETWAIKRCPCAATRLQTLAFSADMAYFLSMTDVGTAFKGQPRCIHSPLIERLRIKPSLSYFCLSEMHCKNYLKSLPAFFPISLLFSCN